MDAATEQLMENLKAYQDILLSAHTEVIYAKEAIKRVRELHKQDEMFCSHCMMDDVTPEYFPCPTIRALNGEIE